MTLAEAQKLLSESEQVPVRGRRNHHPCMLVGLASDRTAWVRPFGHKVDVEVDLGELKLWKGGWTFAKAAR